MSFRDAVSEAIEQARNELMLGLANGNAQDFADYKYRAGQIHGLGTALDLMRDIARKLNERAIQEESE